jgi:hypothetical protein
MIKQQSYMGLGTYDKQVGDWNWFGTAGVPNWVRDQCIMVHSDVHELTFGSGQLKPASGLKLINSVSLYYYPLIHDSRP